MNGPKHAAALIAEAERSAAEKCGGSTAYETGYLRAIVRQLCDRLADAEAPEAPAGQQRVEVWRDSALLYVYVSIEPNVGAGTYLDWDNAEVYSGPNDITSFLDSRVLDQIIDAAKYRVEFGQVAA